MHSCDRDCSTLRSRLSEHGEFMRVSAVLTALNLIFFLRTMLLGKIPSAADILSTVWPAFSPGPASAQNFLLSDVPVACEPWLWLNYFQAQSLQLALWNPYCAAGVPHMANMQSSLFFFPAWPAYAFGLNGITLGVLYFLKLYLAGIFAYYYLRSIKLDAYPALIGAIAFMFLGFNIVWLYYSLSSEMFILPGLLYLIEKIIETKGDKRYLLAFSAINCLGIFAGNPEIFFYISFVSGLYLAFRLLEDESTMAKKAKIVRDYLLFGLLGAALSAIQLLPFVEYLLNSYELVSRNSTWYMLDWRYFIVNIIPEFYGSPSIYHMVPYYAVLGNINYNESTGGYAGIALFYLAMLALTTRYRKRMVQFYLALSIWAIGVVYGLPGIFQATVSLPLFSQAANTRLLFLIGFNTVVLGSIGLNEVLKDQASVEDRLNLKKLVVPLLLSLSIILGLVYSNRLLIYSTSNVNERAIFGQNILTVIAILLLLAVTTLVYGLISKDMRRRNACKAMLLLLVFAETGVHGALFEPAIDEKYFYPDIEPFDRINEDGQLYRTTSIGELGSAYPSNTQLVYGIYDIRNYDVLEIRPYWQLLKTFARGDIFGWVDIYEIDDRLLDFMGVRWIVSRSDISRDVGISVSKNTNPVGELCLGQTIEQKFTSSKANLSAVGLYFATYGRKNTEGNITVLLINESTSSAVRWTSFNSNILENNQWHFMECAPLNDSANATYILRISSNGAPGNSVTIWMNNQLGIPGSLSINGVTTPGSLCFSTYHSSKSAFKVEKRYPHCYLIENTDVMPRAFVVQSALSRKSESEIMEALKDRSFDWRQSIVLQGENESIRYPAALTEADILVYSPTYVKIAARSDQPGFLVISDAYYPGWEARVNGSISEILRANYAFRAVKISAGTSVVEFEYRPLSVYIGAVLTLFAALTAFIIYRRR